MSVLGAYATSMGEPPGQCGHPRHDPWIGVDWKKSSFCSEGNCIEVRVAGDSVLLRDSQQPDAHPFRCSLGDWQAFIQGAKAGEFDLFRQGALPSPDVITA
jgi:hypothetical protein